MIEVDGAKWWCMVACHIGSRGKAQNLNAANKLSYINSNFFMGEDKSSLSRSDLTTIKVISNGTTCKQTLPARFSSAGVPNTHATNTWEGHKRRRQWRWTSQGSGIGEFDSMSRGTGVAAVASPSCSARSGRRTPERQHHYRTQSATLWRRALACIRCYNRGQTKPTTSTLTRPSSSWESPELDLIEMEMAERERVR
jgi:hypothetical protein